MGSFSRTSLVALFVGMTIALLGLAHYSAFRVKSKTFLLCSDVLGASGSMCFPRISSTCLEGGQECRIAVPGGSLKLQDIDFSKGSASSGTAYASGFIRGKFVSGKLHLTLPGRAAALSEEGTLSESKVADAAQNDEQADSGKPIAPDRAKEDGKVKSAKEKKPTAEKSTQDKKTVKSKSKKPDVDRKSDEKSGKRIKPDQKKENDDETVAQLADADSTADAQYKAALKAVMKNIKQKQTKIGSEAEKIAKAVTKVLTSSGVSKTIADLAMDVAMRNSGSQTTASASAQNAGSAITDTHEMMSDPDHFAQFGYAAQPAGTVASSVPVPLRPLSASYYHLWKAIGSPVGMATTSSPMPRQIRIQTAPLHTVLPPPGAVAMRHAEPSAARLHLQPKNPWLAYSEYLEQS